MKRYLLLSTLLLASAFGTLACNKSCGKSDDQKRVFFVTPRDGETVASTFEVKFGVEGMKVRPAGEDLLEKTSGHHHLLIDDAKGYEEPGQAVREDATHIHFGKGQTETTLTLAPGQHKLSMQFADGAHVSYGKEMSETITVTVLPQPTKP